MGFRFTFEEHLSAAVSAFRILERAPDQAPDVILGKRPKLENARARNQRADHLEVRVFGRRADQHDRAVFHMREQRVLLGFVPAMDFVDEEDCADVVEFAALARLGDNTAQFGHAGEHRAESLEVGFCASGDDLGEGGFPAAGWPPKEDRGE
jgi:hypothetical protein